MVYYVTACYIIDSIMKNSKEKAHSTESRCPVIQFCASKKRSEKRLIPLKQFSMAIE